MADPIVIEVPIGGIEIEVPANIPPICLEVGIPGPQGPPGDGLVQAGAVLPAAFSGAPLQATITLPNPYATAAYAVAPKATTVTGRLVPVNVLSRTATQFVLELCSTNLIGIEAIHWISTPHTY